MIKTSILKEYNTIEIEFDDDGELAISNDEYGYSIHFYNGIEFLRILTLLELQIHNKVSAESYFNGTTDHFILENNSMNVLDKELNSIVIYNIASRDYALHLSLSAFKKLMTKLYKIKKDL